MLGGHSAEVAWPDGRSSLPLYSYIAVWCQHGASARTRAELRASSRLKKAPLPSPKPHAILADWGSALRERDGQVTEQELAECLALPWSQKRQNSKRRLTGVPQGGLESASSPRSEEQK